MLLPTWRRRGRCCGGVRAPARGGVWVLARSGPGPLPSSPASRSPPSELLPQPRNWTGRKRKMRRRRRWTWIDPMTGCSRRYGCCRLTVDRAAPTRRSHHRLMGKAVLTRCLTTGPHPAWRRAPGQQLPEALAGRLFLPVAGAAVTAAMTAMGAQHCGRWRRGATPLLLPGATTACMALLPPEVTTTACSSSSGGPSRRLQGGAAGLPRGGKHGSRRLAVAAAAGVGVLPQDTLTSGVPGRRRGGAAARARAHALVHGEEGHRCLLGSGWRRCGGGATHALARRHDLLIGPCLPPVPVAAWRRGLQRRT